MDGCLFSHFHDNRGTVAWTGRDEHLYDSGWVRDTSVNGSTRNALDLLLERVVDEVRSWSRAPPDLETHPWPMGW